MVAESCPAGIVTEPTSILKSPKLAVPVIPNGMNTSSFTGTFRMTVAENARPLSVTVCSVLLNITIGLSSSMIVRV